MSGAVIAVLVAACATEPALATRKRPRLASAHLHALGTRSIPRIRDVVLKAHGPAARAASSLTADAYGGDIVADTGEPVTIYESPSFAPDDAALQSWADYFASLVHGQELERLTVYLAPYDEMQSICSAEADSCFDPDHEMIVLVGQAPPDGQVIEEIAAHEYGHQIAAERDNSPWNAEDFGPKYWSTVEDVCRRVRAFTAFPGDEMSEYSLNPGEAWAEANRVLNGGSWSGVVDGTFRPTKNSLFWAKQDILHPYESGYYTPRKGRFRRRHARSAWFSLPIDNDGSIDIQLAAKKPLDADLYLYAGKRLLKSARLYGRKDRLRYRACGYRKLRLRVYRYSGYGSFSLRAFLPFDGPSAGASALRRRGPR